MEKKTAPQPGEPHPLPYATAHSLKKRLYVLLPKSLLGQLVCAFSLSLLAILVIGATYAHDSKIYYSLRGMMSFHTRSMADSALLLETAMPFDRPRIAQRMGIRGIGINLSPHEPDFSQKTAATYSDEEDLMMRLLILALEDIWVPKAREEDFHERLARIRRKETDLPNGLPKIFIQEVNGPSFFVDTAAVIQRSLNLGKRLPRPPAYIAEVAIPLADGTWVLFEDEAPSITGMPGLPLKGILFVELFFVLVSLLVFYLIINPLRRLSQAADMLGKDIPGAPPLPETGPKEVREGAVAFNRMQRRIRDFVDQRTSTLAAVSHDLRTPLTRMRLRLEQLEDNTLKELLQKDLDALQQLTDTAMDLARSGQNEELALVDVSALVESLVEDRQDMGQDVQLITDATLTEAAPIRVRPLSIKRCLNNILDNAVRYGKGPVLVQVEDNQEELYISICDHGPGIPEEYMHRVFDPFFRLEPSRNRNTGGSGLGMAIARTMARAHGGDITLTNREEGGLMVQISFRRYS